MKKNILKKIFKILLIIIIVFVLFSVFLTIIYKWVNPPISFLMISRKIEMKAEINYKYIDIKDIPQSVINCAVAAEDNNFLAHNGIDFSAIKKTFEERKKGRIRGASTISQQTAKNVFLWQGRSYIRKGLEAYFTVLIEIFWSKERIMEIYLNVIEMGKGIYGIEAASQYYYNKSAKYLTPYQSALIVSSFPAPLKFNPRNPSEYLANRANNVLNLSYKIGNIKFDKESIISAKERYEKRKKTNW
ncbi:MAG: monofunctional biosynthetic peptidoglycan transglycosylase [Bacteroidales bacterium]|jgi:monofunctional biosynthetic peptidoglycan transglycosylase|nr:monofunctional biosynthetic peptidoglycan transglycosylase [Bacteroidales bacterium]